MHRHRRCLELPERSGPADAGKQGNYVLCIKQNQRALFKKVKTLLNEAVIEKLQGWKATHHQETCGGHGRIETRDIWCTSEVEHLGQLGQDWPALAAVAVVQCRRQVHGGNRRCRSVITC